MKYNVDNAVVTMNEEVLDVSVEHDIYLEEAIAATAVTAATLIENSKAAKQTVFPDPVDPNNVPKLYGVKAIQNT